MSFEIVPACHIPFPEQARIANEAFAGYVGGWHDLDAESLARFLCLQGADIFYSRFVRQNDRLAGFGYINRTGNILRLAGMAISPQARGSGAAAHLLEHLCAEAKERADETMMLEVIQQNPRGVAFYRRHGFREIGQLFGWRRAANTPSSAEAEGKSEEIPILTALQMPSAHNYPDLPYQITAYAFAKVAGARAFAMNDARIVLSDPAAQTITIHGLFCAGADSTKLRRLMAALLHQFPSREFFAAPKFPEQWGTEIFAPLGFTREPISQFLMRRDF